MARTLLALLLTLALVVPAVAADPEAATVDAASPSVSWTGEATDPTSGAYLVAQAEESASDVCDTPLPACDHFTLTVAPGATKLTIVVTADVEDDYVGLSVTDPAGEEVAFHATDSPSETAVIEAPAAGEYLVQVLGSPLLAPSVPYKGTATLEFPAKEPDPQPSPTPAPTPEPTPEPTPAPPPPPPAADPPAPAPAQAAPRTLAIQPDRRRVRLASRFGFRTRVVCRGGCETVKVRVYVSRLTARNLRLGNFDGDVVVGSAPVVREAEGRRQVVVSFRKAFRKRLGRAKSLPLSVEAVVTDSDGTVRMTFKRLTLRR